MSDYPVPESESPVSQVHLLPLLLGLAVFFGFSALGRLTMGIGLSLMSIAGFLIPLSQAWRTGAWREMGFALPNKRAIGQWTVGAGLFTALLGIILIGKVAIPPNLLVQMLVGAIVWILAASPFQELFFRAWLQTRLQKLLGDFSGLMLASILFVLWHYVAPLNTTAVPLYTLPGLLGTFLAGLVYGYSFYRTRSFATPWLAHATAGMAFVLIGSVDFLAEFGQFSLF
jgi:membrane protease YdiL (CAAX protease family)